MFERIPLPMAWPVYVSNAEASAYARWRGARLPTEAEYQRAAFGGPTEAIGDRPRLHPWGDAAPAAAHGVFDFSSWDPQPAGSHPAGASAWGVEDLAGNGWEWTSSTFAPFPGFRADGVVPRVLGGFFRRRAFRHERRVARDRTRVAKAELPQLVPRAVPVRVRYIQVRQVITHTSTSSTHAAQFAADVQYYLTLEPRQLPSRYLYDDLGSALFDAICALPWYGITRAETRLLAAHGRAVFAAVPGLTTIIELGPGSGAKLATLVDVGRRRTERLDLRLVDISPSALDAGALERWPRCRMSTSSPTRTPTRPGWCRPPPKPSAAARSCCFSGRTSAISIGREPKSFCAACAPA